MALKRNEKYPGRFNNPTPEHPQGAFKNRTSPTAQDGSYLEASWANDLSALQEAILRAAGVTPNGNEDTAISSQVFNALKLLGLRVSGTQVFTQSGSFTVPANVTEIYVSGCAGGGGGGGSQTSANATVAGSGGGGGGGNSLKAKYTVVPGTNHSVTIGNPGLGGAAGGGTGGDGSATILGSMISLTGGAGGSVGQSLSNSASGGAPGAKSGTVPGGWGGDSQSVEGGGAYGGSGGQSLFGTAGNTVRGNSTPIPGQNALGWGGGGGGAGGSNVNGAHTGAKGGDGSPGLLIIEW